MVDREAFVVGSGDGSRCVVWGFLVAVAVGCLAEAVAEAFVWVKGREWFPALVAVLGSGCLVSRCGPPLVSECVELAVVCAEELLVC